MELVQYAQVGSKMIVKFVNLDIILILHLELVIYVPLVVKNALLQIIVQDAILELIPLLIKMELLNVYFLVLIPLYLSLLVFII